MQTYTNPFVVPYAALRCDVYERTRLWHLHVCVCAK